MTFGLGNPLRIAALTLCLALGRDLHADPLRRSGAAGRGASASPQAAGTRPSPDLSRAADVREAGRDMGVDAAIGGARVVGCDTCRT